MLKYLELNLVWFLRESVTSKMNRIGSRQCNAFVLSQSSGNETSCPQMWTWTLQIELVSRWVGRLHEPSVLKVIVEKKLCFSIYNSVF